MGELFQHQPVHSPPQQSGLELFLVALHIAAVMMVVMIPAMLFAMYEKNGQPLEVVIRNIYRVCFQRPKQRPYKPTIFMPFWSGKTS